MALELEVELAPGPRPGTYAVNVVRSPAGEASSTMELDVDAVLARRPALQADLLESAVEDGGSAGSAGAAVEALGRLLFAAVFSGEVYGRYAASLATAAVAQTPLRIVLRLRAPGLAALPWEALFDPETERFVCQYEPLVRYVQSPTPTPPLTVPPPLHVLGVAAAPADLPPIDVAGERRRVEDALRPLLEAGRVVLTWVTSGTWADVQGALQDRDVHVVHVVGHGGYDAAQDVGLLALVGPDGAADLVPAERFAALLHAAVPAPRLVVLNACSTGQSGVDDVFSGTAAALARNGVVGVVAMQFVVSDQAALAFVRGLYDGLARNAGLDEAVRQGRLDVMGTSPRTLEWLTPVLYLRTAQSHLFQLTRGGAPVPWWRRRRLLAGLAAGSAAAATGLVLAWPVGQGDCGAFADSFAGAELSEQWTRQHADDIAIAGGRAEVTAADGADVRPDLVGTVTAPWLSRPVTGSFELTARVEVDPRFTYQAAGLLLHRDDGNFVRLERGFGTEGAIVFEYAADGRHLKIHGPFAGENVVPTSATRVELRLVRDGTAVRAAWRPAGATEWNDLGGGATLEGDATAGVTVVNTSQPPEGDPERRPIAASFDEVAVRCLGG